MTAPGLFPEDSPPGRSPLKPILALLVLAFLLVSAWFVLQVSRLRMELADERKRMHELAERFSRRPEPPPSPPPVLTKSLDDFVDLPPPEVRAAPVADASERLRLGAEELRAGRVDAAEAQFFRAGASGLPFLVVSCLARGDWEDAWAHVVRAAGADRFWFRKADPRVLLGPETLARVIAALEGRVRDNPLDARAKTLLAYLLYHEKSPSHATGLLVAATGVDPGNAEARQFLENHDR
jgi:hypothetical protein